MNSILYSTSCGSSTSNTTNTICSIDTVKVSELSLVNEEEISNSQVCVKIFDFSVDLHIRIKAIILYNIRLQGCLDEIVNRLISMYYNSTIISIRETLVKMVTSTPIDVYYKIEIIKALLDVEEDEDQTQSDQLKADDNQPKVDDNKPKADKDQPKVDQLKADEDPYDLLFDLCTHNMTAVAIACRTTSIFLLMKSPKYKKEAKHLLYKIINDKLIDVVYRYKIILSLENLVHERQYYIKRVSLAFIKHSDNPIKYKILCCQYLLRNLKEKNLKDRAESYLLNFCCDVDLDFTVRGDAADVLLNLGSESSRAIALDVIRSLGREGDNRTIFDNSQNVHTKAVEESASVILEYLNSIVNRGEPFDNIKKILLLFAKSKMKVDMVMLESSLTRVELDRAVYTKYSMTLSTILGKVYEYVNNLDHYRKLRESSQSEGSEGSEGSEDDQKDQEEIEDSSSGSNPSDLSGCEASEEQVKALQDQNRDELITRIIEELMDANNLCSSGYAFRIANVLSGYDNFSIKISFEDQITANLAGRLNAKIRVDNNSDNILEQMSIDSHKYGERKAFLEFFNANISSIRQEMYLEFKQYMNDEDFDLYFMKALLSYDCR